MCMYSPAGIFVSGIERSGFIPILLWFAFFINHSLTAQDHFQFDIYIDSVEDSKTFANVRDSIQLHGKIEQWISLQRKEGFFLTGLDSIVKDGFKQKYYLHKGEVYKFVVLRQDSMTTSELNSLPMSHSIPVKSTPEYWSNQFASWIQYCANHSYPFARIDVSPIRISSDSLIALYSFHKGRPIYFHQTDQRQKKLIDDQVLNRIIGVIPGDPYNQDLVEGIQDKIGRLAYLQMRSSPRVLFLGNEGIVWLYLEKARASKFDVLLGLSPETGLSNKKYQLTGEAGFEILNSLKTGEKIFLKYENLIENAPRLKLGFDFPYVKFMPFGLSADFHLYRFGEQYIDLSTQFVISYPWSLSQNTGLSFTYLSSSVLNPDSLTLSRTFRLPSQLDYNYLAAGLRHIFNDLDYRPNPSTGWAVLLDVKVGTKTFKTNTVLLSYESDRIHVQQQYDSLNLNKEQAIYLLSASRYIHFNSRHVIKLALLSNGILGSGKILDNELIRIGGYKNLRGFDEDFYKCQHAIIPTLEYRFLLDRNSFLNVFSDFAYLNQPLDQQNIWNWYEGFGLGIQFQTKVGAFSLQYAMGASKTQSVDFGKGKIHFGYSTLF